MRMKKPESTFYAHSKEGEPPEKWQRLDEHLKNVPEMARGLRKILIVVNKELEDSNERTF